MDVVEAGTAGEPGQVAGAKGVHVDLALEGVAIVVGLVWVVPGARADRTAPQRPRDQGSPLRERGDQVAVARGLAAEGEDAAGA